MSNYPTYPTDFRHWSADAEFPARPLPTHEWRNGLLVRMPNHLGDAVMALPALLALRTLLPPACGLYVIAPESMRQLYAAVEGVDGVVCFSKAHAWWSVDTLHDLRALRMGAAVLFNNSLRDTIMLRLTGVPHLYGAAKRGRSILLTRSFRFPARRSRELAGAHLAKRCLAVAAALGAEVSSPRMPAFDLSRMMIPLTSTLVALARHPLHLILAAGAAYGEAKRWPESGFRTVARYWLRHGGVVSVVGSAAERAVGDAVLAGLPPERCFNLCGETSLNALMVLLKSAALCVANDSGVMHLAAALGTPGVAVFGPTDPAATAPVSERWKVLYKQLPCAP
ncbi:MAG: lipopolysaccharide heptosyltransferase II, partial [Lentisphaeria bacterium]|nr:lipopolysaccharide heptosyltransferase II [Lentisphaeria bacterium]